ncbi:hypothetical protein [Pseudomonas serbica]
MRGVLLGGSNSVFDNGLVSGLRANCDLERLSLGATSCAQNLFEIVRNSEKIKSADVVVTESNVNDSFNFSLMGLELDFVLAQIDEFYLQLSTLTRKVYVVVLPINIHLPGVEPVEIILSINDRHVKNCMHHGFRLVDVSDSAKGLNKQDAMNLIPHARHLNEAIQHQIAVNICDHVKANPFIERPLQNPIAEYAIVAAGDLPVVSARDKKNSRFNEVVYDLQCRNKFPSRFEGWRIKAAATWSDGYSILKLSSNTQQVSKAFQDAIMVVEFVDEVVVDESTFIESSFDNVRASEKTPLVSYVDGQQPGPVGLIAFLVRRGSIPNVVLAENYALEVVKCSSIVPNLVPFARSFQTWLNLNKVVSRTKYDALFVSLSNLSGQMESIVKSGKLFVSGCISFWVMDAMDALAEVAVVFG